MNVAVYIRVSTEDQTREGYSLEIQREYLESFANREGDDIFKVYCDDGISAYSTRREALQQLLKDAKDKKFDLAIVYKIDRFSRNLKDLLMLVDELSSYGVAFKSATEPFDTSTSVGKLMFQQLGSFAEFERNRIAECVFPGMMKGVQQGNWQGARYAPYGYRYNKEKKLLEIDEQAVKVVKIIFEMALVGKAIRYITGYLTKKGYRNRNGNIFSTKLIGDILKNRIYTGKLVWNQKHYDKSQRTAKGYKYIKNSPDKVIIVKGRHEALVTDEDFERVQEFLKVRRRERKRKASDYPLSGVLYCAKCNHKYLGISSISNHRTGLKKRWYRCSGPHSSHINCTNRAVKAEDIEPEATKIVAQLIQNERLKQCRWTTGTLDEIASSLASLAPRNDEGGTAARNDGGLLKDKLKNNQEKQSKLTDAYLENLLGEDVYHDKITALRKDEEELKKQLALQSLREIEREHSEEYMHRVEDFLAGYGPGKQALNCHEQKQVLGLLFKNITLDIFDVKGFFPFRPLQFFLF